MYDIVILSGGFDPVHKGHVRMVLASAELGEKVIVGVNSDSWLVRKKGKNFMSLEERIEIMSAFLGVHEARGFNDEDNTACDLIRAVRKENPDLSIAFANGGDRTSENVPEDATCNDCDVDMLWGVGGGKIQSSSDLIKNAQMS